MILRSAFGNNHREVNGAHLAQELQFLAFSSIFNVFSHIPGYRYLPTENNLRLSLSSKESDIQDFFIREWQEKCHPVVILLEGLGSLTQLYQIDNASR